jgi:hypothetical protein
MDEGRKKTLIGEARAVIISVILVPAILAWLQVSPPVIVGIGLSLLVILSGWENGYLTPARWSPDGRVQDGKLRALVGIVGLCLIVGGGYIASHWPTAFLRSSRAPSATDIGVSKATGPLASRLDHFILECDIPPPAGKTVEQTIAELNEYKKNMDVLGDALGLSITLEAIRGGIRMEIEAVTDEAKRRTMPFSSLGVTKLTLEVRRVAKVESVSAFVKIPPQLEFFSLFPPNPLAPDTIAARQKIEQILGVRHGTCHVI